MTLAIREVLQKRYHIVSLLGQGSMSQIYLPKGMRLLKDNHYCRNLVRNREVTYGSLLPQSAYTYIG